jgi:hypothetical protein
MILACLVLNAIIMKSTLIALLLFTGVAYNTHAQVVTKDSMNTLKEEKSVIALNQQINERKLKLAALENDLQNKINAANSAEDEAQKSAKENAAIAEKLRNDATDKSISRKARKASRSAEKDAKRARIASARLKELQDDIDALKKRITADEQKLATLQ